MISKWTEQRRGHKTRFVYQTEQYTASVRHVANAGWLWTVHCRGSITGRRRLEAHGKCKEFEEAQRAAETAIGCECAEAGARNCGAHQNEGHNFTTLYEASRDGKTWIEVIPPFYGYRFVRCRFSDGSVYWSLDGGGSWLKNKPNFEAETLGSFKPSQPCCVYFVGSDSTGKTELAKSVENRYGLPRIHEGARAVLAEESLSLANLRVSSEAADEFQRRVFDRQLELEKRPRPFVADRGLFDNLAYAGTHARCYADLVERPEVRPYAAQMANDAVFLVRPQRETRAEDGVRVLPTWEMQHAIDAKIELLLKQFRVPFVEIAVSSSASRADLVDWCLQAKGFRKVK